MQRLSESGRWHLVDRLEDPGKMKGILEPERGGNRFHRGIRFKQNPRGLLHPQASEKLIRTLIVKPSKKPTQIGGINLAGTSDAIKRGDLDKIALNEVLDARVSRESGRVHPTRIGSVILTHE